ncbi:Legumain [Aphelenchoides besseyi]|nr:Legumain [Aphelenchoides besseyi]
MQIHCLVLLFAIGTTLTLAAPPRLLPSGIDPSNTHVVLVSAIGCEDDEYSKWNCALVYGIEAEIAHVYHLLIEQGIPEDNIITLFKNNSQYAGYTKPEASLFDDLNYTTNWRPGLKVDYIGNDVSPQNFLAVIQGDESALNHTSGTGRVLKTTKSDNIFIYHGGHGDSGVLYFSDDWIQVLTAKELHSTLLSMKNNNQFDQMLYYITACFSGSMFEDFLTKQGNIFGVTAADPDESAYLKDCVDDGEQYYCVNSEFGWAYVNDDTQNDPQVETMSVQYSNIRQVVLKSNVSKYGSLAVSSEPTAYFQGPNKLSGKSTDANSMNAFNDVLEESISIAPVASYLLMKRQLAASKSEKEVEKLQEQLTSMEKERDEIQELTSTMVKKLAKPIDRKVHEKLINSRPSSITAVDCHHDVMKAFARECSKFSKSPFILELTRPLINLCEHGVEAVEIISKLQEHCI